MQNLDAIFDLTNEIMHMQRILADKLDERRDLLRGVDLSVLTDDQISDLVLREWEKDNDI